MTHFPPPLYTPENKTYWDTWWMQDIRNKPMKEDSKESEKMEGVNTRPRGRSPFKKPRHLPPVAKKVLQDAGAMIDICSDTASEDSFHSEDESFGPVSEEEFREVISSFAIENGISATKALFTLTLSKLHPQKKQRTT